VAGLVVFTVTAAWVGQRVLQRAGFAPATAFFSAAPGGLNDMVIIGGEVRGWFLLETSRRRSHLPVPRHSFSATVSSSVPLERREQPLGSHTRPYPASLTR